MIRCKTWGVSNRHSTVGMPQYLLGGCGSVHVQHCHVVILWFQRIITDESVSKPADETTGSGDDLVDAANRLQSSLNETDVAQGQFSVLRSREKADHHVLLIS